MTRGADLLVKVEGAGNDFLLAAGAWATRLAADATLVRRLCDRRRGVGADGVLAVSPRGRDRLRLVYSNRDGSVAAFCANGTRCAARAGHELLGLASRLVVETDWVPIPARVAGAEVALDLPPPGQCPRRLRLEAAGAAWDCWWLEVGVPHLVVPVDDPAAHDLGVVGPALRHHPDLGADGANVSLVGDDPRGGLSIRSFERGVEAETLACGSGIVAAALVAMSLRGVARLDVRPRSGDTLEVQALADPPRCPSRLTGPARIVARLEPTAELLG